MLFSSPARAYTWTFEPSTKVVTAEGGVYDKADLRAFSESITMPSDDMSSSIVLDLSAVEFFPSVAISILAAQQRRATSDDVQVRLVAAPETIPHRVLSITGIDFDEAL